MERTTVNTDAAARTLHIAIDHPSAVQSAADQARSAARGMPGALPDQAAVLASELASNIVKHARNGALFIQRSPLRGGMDIVAVDSGPGMPDVALSLRDGYSTTKTIGAGLGAARRIATDFAIRSDGGLGTLAHARLAEPDEPRAPAALGSLCLPADGEHESGDGYAVAEHDGTRTVLVIDGLGHGAEAATAAQRAERTFLANPTAPLVDIIAALHKALRHTRGAAAAVLRTTGDRIEFCGIGNVRATTLSPRGIHHQLTGHAGIVGYNLPKPRSRFVDLAEHTTVVLYTDGIDHRWTHAPTDARLTLPPVLLAASLAHTHRRRRDDATILALGPHLGMR
ncbi:SpoIIE family protein phosphatase [Streptomyces sp. NPDC018029]|uniref:SpoIIE family protein phosphatase n=1 Tax=Streptomyces sp. NPDC018029 TaxID=3365032 RepID=UPI0037A693FE